MYPTETIERLLRQLPTAPQQPKFAESPIRFRRLGSVESGSRLGYDLQVQLHEGNSSIEYLW